MDHKIIYYFTGTGNSLAVAKSICISTPEFQLIPIASFRNQKEIPVTGAKIGIVFPLYFAGLPLIVKNFMEKLSFAQECYIFAIVTCGFPWSGFALHQVNRVLKKKNKN